MWIELANKEHVVGVSSILRARGLDPKAANDLPELGLIVRDKYSIIAAGYLRKVEGGFLIMDSMITCPEEHPITRDKAMTLLFGELIKTAKELGFKGITGTSVDGNTINRAIRHGFQVSDHVFLVKDLRE